MIITKIINNNVVGTHDKDNREIVIMGSGIGFKKKIGDAIPEDKIEKKFTLDSQDEVSRFSELITNIPHNYLDVSVEIIEHAKQIMEKRLSKSIYISLTDHINFALERVQQNMLFENPLLNEVKSFYPSEFLIGEYSIQLIEKKLGVKLPKDEAASIALHFVNAEYNNIGMGDTMNVTCLIKESIQIVEDQLGIKMDERGLNYARFITHLKFLAQRIFMDELLDNQDPDFLDMIINKYPVEYKVSNIISDYVEEKYNRQITKEEKVYLTVYIRRVRIDNEKSMEEKK